MLSSYAESMLEAAIYCDGLEVHREDWPTAEEIVRAGKGTLGPARGPAGAWRRLMPKEVASGNHSCKKGK